MTGTIVTHKCGHAHARDLSDTAASQRAKKAEWWSTQECKACAAETWKAKQRAKPLSKERKAEHAAHRQAALEDARRLDLPPLQGSEKQVGWGTDLRYDALRNLYEELVQSERMTEDEYDDLQPSLQRSEVPVDVAESVDAPGRFVCACFEYARPVARAAVLLLHLSSLFGLPVRLRFVKTA